MGKLTDYIEQDFNDDKSYHLLNYELTQTKNLLDTVILAKTMNTRILKGRPGNMWQVARITMLRGEDGRISKTLSSKKSVSLNNEAIKAFKKLKSSLISPDVILHYPDFKKEFHLTTDASNFAVGAVLSQGNRPISFLSRTLSKAEENYATNEKEMLAIIWALKKLKIYLYGKAKVKIFTEHQPLTLSSWN